VRFEVFTAVMIQVEVFWVVMPCTVGVEYHFRGCEATWMWRWRGRQHVPL